MILFIFFRYAEAAHFVDQLAMIFRLKSPAIYSVFKTSEGRTAGPQSDYLNLAPDSTNLVLCTTYTGNTPKPVTVGIIFNI